MGVLMENSMETENRDATHLLQEPGREIRIGKKIFTIQRNLTDNLWDVELPTHGWQSTYYPAEYTAVMVEARFRNDFKGGIKKFLNRRTGAVFS